MSGDFPIHVKSTLDRTMVNIKDALTATYPTLQAVDIDNIKEVDALASSSAPAVIWQFSTLEPNPRDPLYRGSFLIGAKTTEDAGNYKLTDLVSELLTYFESGISIPVSDYSGEGPAVDGKGTIRVSSYALSPQQYDKQSGIRFYNVFITGQRFT